MGKQNEQTGRLLKRLYSITDLADEVGATKWFWRTQITEGKIPYVQVGRKMFIDGKDVEQFLSDHKKCY